MKTLDIIRHAKSSWSFASLDDYSRPLGKRGRQDLLKMAQYFRQHQVTGPEKIVTSPASRAFYTALFFADMWEYPEEEVQLEAALYHANEEEIFEILEEHSEINHLAIVGHNPGFTELIQVIARQTIDNLPTCGMMRLTYDAEDWDEIAPHRMISQVSYFPKAL